MIMIIFYCSRYQNYRL